jgi:N-hydroxyarylamine O-acetyltransferase
MVLDAYFERIGWRGPREPTLPVLTDLCLLHTSTFPFENLDILLGRGIALDVPALLEKFVTRRRGGYCFEHNALMLAALRELGFRVTPLSGRVRLGVAPDVATPRTHMLLRVDLDAGPHLVDVGFGFTPTAPLRFEPGVPQPLHLGTYRLKEDGGAWTLEIEQPEGFTPAYVFTQEPCAPIDYEVANHYTSTHPRSHFTLGPLVMRHDPRAGVRYVLRGREWSTRRAGVVGTHAVTSPEEARRVLADVFRLEFPPGTVFRGLE